MITTYYRNIKDPKLIKVDKFRTGSWIHMQSPTEEELAQVIAKFNLDAGHVRDALDPDEMPRLETEGDTTYVFMRYTYNNDGRLFTAPVALIVGPKAFITIAPQPFPNLELFTKGKLEVFTTQRAKLFLQVMRHITNTYNIGLNTINRQIRGARAGLNVTSISNRNFVQFVVIEDVLNDYLSELMPTNNMLTNLLAGKHSLSFYEEDRDIIEDLVLGTRQSIESSKSNLKTIVNIREAYSNIMTNNLNRQIKLLTSLTIILMVPNVIAGFFGMNVPIPLQDYPWAFPAIVLATLGLCSYLIWLFNRRGWL